MMIDVPFVKMQGLGNDFMVVDATRPTGVDWSVDQVCRLANRRLGIGFDQLLVVERSSGAADFFVRIINADGSEAEQCGNGMRCVARCVAQWGLISGSAVVLETRGAQVSAEVLSDGMVRVEMGQPEFSPDRVPCIWLDYSEAAMPTLMPVSVMGRDMACFPLSVGNPHAVVPVEAIIPEEVALLGSALGRHEAFPAGVNVGFMQVINSRHIHLRVYERGAGETMACGSGACAAMIAGRRLGLLHAGVRVDQAGGTLEVEWPGLGHSVIMTGPAAWVYGGVVSMQRSLS